MLAGAIIVSTGFCRAGEEADNSVDWSKIKEGAKEAGNAVVVGTKKGAHAVGTGAKKGAHAVETGAKKAGSAIKEGYEDVKEYLTEEESDQPATLEPIQ